MATPHSVIQKISDYLKDRQKNTNFGTCKLCNKKVYWSTTKVASHIRSGHCAGASEEEVSLFKTEFVYDSPKNLVHKSQLVKIEGGAKRKLQTKKEPSPKKPKEEVEVIHDPFEGTIEHESDEQIMYEVEQESDQEDNEKLEILYVQEGEFKSSVTSETLPPSKEEKFIAAVYPQFKGKTKIQLIDEILDLKRQNELLVIKTKTYENTIHKLL